MGLDIYFKKRKIVGIWWFMSEIEKLKALKEKISKESSAKRDMRRKNESCYIPRSYYMFGYTKRDLFKRDLIKAREKLNEKVR